MGLELRVDREYFPRGEIEKMMESFEKKRYDRLPCGYDRGDHI